MNQATKTKTASAEEVQIRSGKVQLQGELIIPEAAAGVVLFAHGSGSSRHSPRNQFVARTIREAGIATLLFDLLTRDEEAIDMYTRQLRFDIALLAERLVDATRWVKDKFNQLHIGYFGASTGAGAALIAAAELPDSINAVVSRGGRPDLAGNALTEVKSPTLLLVGGLDYTVIKLNEEAFARLNCEKQMRIIPNATHLFEEPGALEKVSTLAAQWFSKYLSSAQ